MRLLRACVFVVVLLAGVLCLVDGAFGAQADWRVLAQALPSNLPPGGSGEIELNVLNVGDAPSNGGPVMLVDHLPVGVKAVRASSLEENELVTGPWGPVAGECEITEAAGASTVACVYEGGAIATDSFDSVGQPTSDPTRIGIEVQVAAGLAGQTVASVTTVSGGGALETASDTLDMTVSGALEAFGVGSVQEWLTNADGSADVQAGSHPYEMMTSITFPVNAAGEVTDILRDVHVDLPPGLAGNVNATPRCTRVQFDARLNGNPIDPACPTDSQIGVVSVYIEPNHFAYIPLYNLVPPAGVPAQFAFAAGDRSGFLNASVQTGGSYALSIDARNLPEIPTTGVIVSIWGNPSDPSHDLERFAVHHETPAGEEGSSIPYSATPRPLMTLPGVCGAPQVFGVSVDSWENPLEQAAGGEYAPALPFDGLDEQDTPASLEGCGLLPFQPSLSVAVESGRPDTPSGLEAELSFPQPESTFGLAESDLKEAAVTLPAGMALSPSAANGLGACSPAQIALASPNKPTCPDSSKVGVVHITSPDLETGQELTGSVFVAQQGNLPGNGSNPFGSLIALYIVAEGDGVLVKLPGQVTLDQATGQITATFAKDPVTSAATGSEQFLPDLPVGKVRMSFFGGERASLITPPTCGIFAATALLTPWATGEPVARESNTFSTVPAPAAGPCPAGGFAPSLQAGSTSSRAGSYSPFTASFSRNDGEQRIGAVKLTLPPGLLANIKSVPRCNEPQAAEGTCPSESLIGEATVAAGPGASPFWVKGGKVYLTGPYAGAPFGLSVVVPAVAGPFNLGTNGKPIVVRSAISIDPHTAQVTVTSENPIPHILQGVPLDIKTINITINRPNFTINPTNCNPLTATGTLTALNNSTQAAVSSPFQATNCATLPFKPHLTAITHGKASKTNGAYLQIKVTVPPGDANFAKTKLTLPIQLPSRLTTLQKACLAHTFETNPASCPPASMIGTATATTPLIQAPFTGPAYLVSYGGEAFPAVVFVLQAEGITIDLTSNTNIKHGITTETLNNIPDTPVTTFTATFPTGPHSILGTNLPEKTKYNLCKQTLNMPTILTSQNELTTNQTTTITPTSCTTHKHGKHTHGKK